VFNTAAAICISAELTRYRAVPYKGPIRLFKLVDDALARVVTRYVRSDGAQRRHCDGVTQVTASLARVVTRYVRSDGAQRRHCDGQEHRARLRSQFKLVDDALARVCCNSVSNTVRAQ
jgi:hypothetical protein